MARKYEQVTLGWYVEGWGTTTKGDPGVVRLSQNFHSLEAAQRFAELAKQSNDFPETVCVRTKTGPDKLERARAEMHYIA